MTNEELKLFLQALSIQETGWTNSKTVGSHNVYNIKDPSGKGTRAYDRREGSNDAYRNFQSREEADQEVIALLRRRYPDALTATTIEEFTDALRRGGYATDANHGAGIRKIYYRLKNGDAPAPAPVQERQSIDFSRYEANYGDKIRKARADGFDDETIMRTIQRDEANLKSTNDVRSKIDAARPRAEIDVAARLARSGQWIDGVAYLATLPGFKEEKNHRNTKTNGKSNASPRPRAKTTEATRRRGRRSKTNRTGNSRSRNQKRRRRNSQGTKKSNRARSKSPTTPPKRRSTKHNGSRERSTNGRIEANSTANRNHRRSRNSSEKSSRNSRSRNNGTRTSEPNGRSTREKSRNNRRKNHPSRRKRSTSHETKKRKNRRRTTKKGTNGRKQGQAANPKKPPQTTTNPNKTKRGRRNDPKRQTDVTGGVSAVGVGVPCEEATATLKDVVEAVDKVNLSLTNAGPAKSGFEALLASGATELTNLYRTFDSTPAYMAGFTNMTLNVPAPTGVTAPVTGMLTGPVDLVGLWMPRSIREQNWAIWIKSAIALAFTFELMVFGAREALNMQKFQLQLPATTMSSQGSIPGLGGALFLLRVAALAGIMLAAPGFILGYIFDFGNSGILETIIDMMTEGGPQQVMVDNAQGVLLGFSEIWATLNLYVPTVTIGLCAYLRHSWQIGGARLLLLSHWIVRQFPT